MTVDFLILNFSIPVLGAFGHDTSGNRVNHGKLELKTKCGWHLYLY